MTPEVSSKDTGLWEYLAQARSKLSIVVTLLTGVHCLRPETGTTEGLILRKLKIGKHGRHQKNL